MNTQGTPISGAGDGTKNTSDPRARDPVYENPGGVTSDSLAAESGAFQRANPNSNPTGVSGGSSTYANTDTSGATRLDPARDASARGTFGADDSAQGSAGGLKYAEGLGGQADANPSGFTTSSSGLTSATGGLENSGYQAHGLRRGSGGPADDAVAPGSTDEAPGYITSVVGGGGEDRPHGRGLTEGGFTGEAGNTLAAEPGSVNDPGRAAVDSFQASNAKVAGSVGDTRTGGLDDSTRFDGLAREERT